MNEVAYRSTPEYRHNARIAELQNKLQALCATTWVDVPFEDQEPDEYNSPLTGYLSWDGTNASDDA